MTARLEQHGDVKVRVHRYADQRRFVVPGAHTYRRWLVTCGTQAFLADAPDSVAAASACGLGCSWRTPAAELIDRGDVKVRLAEPSDVETIVDILELELEVKSWPKPAERPKVRRLRPAPRYDAGRPRIPELYGGKAAA